MHPSAFHTPRRFIPEVLPLQILADCFSGPSLRASAIRCTSTPARRTDTRRSAYAPLGSMASSPGFFTYVDYGSFSNLRGRDCISPGLALGPAGHTFPLDIPPERFNPAGGRWSASNAHGRQMHEAPSTTWRQRSRRRIRLRCTPSYTRRSPARSRSSPGPTTPAGSSVMRAVACSSSIPQPLRQHRCRPAVWPPG
jgi:hypothetical protein